jgi:hypothetical protein
VRLLLVAALTAIVLAPAAHADPDPERELATIYAICQRLGAHPSTATVRRIVSDLLTIGYEPSEVARLTTYGVARVCPENLPVVRRAYEGITA